MILMKSIEYLLETMISMKKILFLMETLISMMRSVYNVDLGNLDSDPKMVIFWKP